MKKATCPSCQQKVTVLVPPFRRGHRPLWKFTLHRADDDSRCDASFTAVPNQES